MAFGLLGLLVTIGVIVLILNFAILPYNKAVIDKGQNAREQAEQMAGVKDGMRAMDSFKVEPQNNSSGKTVSLLVTSVTAGGPMESYYGLKRNDTITAINGMPVRDQNDGEMAVAMAQEAYQRQQTLTVVRDGETLVLPQQNQAATPAAPAAAAAQNQEATPAKPRETGGLQGQLDAIQGAAGAR
jgi:C-terminal processing protease CtpA/Prc